MNRGCFFIAALLAAGCARFHPQPLSPSKTAEALENRSLTNAALRSFLAQNLGRELPPEPVKTWDFEMLCLAAWYYHPSLDVARAQWAVARGGETTAAQRPNPTLNVTPGYDTTTLTPSPWIPLGFLDIPLETAGKRGYRRAQAAQLSEAARLNISTVAWQVRSDLRSSLLDYTAAGQREGLLVSQLALQEQVMKTLSQEVAAGEISSSETVPFRIAIEKARLDLADARRQRAEGHARVSAAIGIPARALEGVTIVFDLAQSPPALSELASAEVQRTALLSRPDILGALAEYAASEVALQLEIARQYPDVHLQPGYQFDQGDNKWSLGLTVELPVLSQNQGPIAEAAAKRQESAARFNALQAKVLAEIERAMAVFRASEANLTSLGALAEAQSKRTDSIAAQVQAGEAERLDLLNAQYESAAAGLVQLDGRIKYQQAVGALEDAVRRPLSVPPAVLQAKQADAR